MSCGYYINRYGGTSYRCNRLSHGGIAGVVVGIVAFLVLLCLFFFLFKGCLRRRRKATMTQRYQQPMTQPVPSQGPQYNHHQPYEPYTPPQQTYAPPLSYNRSVSAQETSPGGPTEYSRPLGPPPGYPGTDDQYYSNEPKYPSNSHNMV